MDILINCLFAFCACLGFCFIFHVRRSIFPFAALGGALGWLVYSVTAPVGSDFMQYFLATIAISIYAEGMARLFKAPVTCFLVVAMLPLVPGGGIYYTMEYALNGNTQTFLESLFHTIGIAGALALGIMLVSSVVHLWRKILSLHKAAR